MVHLLELIYFLILIKAVLRCLYFWQIKEYRFDRFKAFLKTKEASLYFLPTRHLLRPKFTLKALLLAYLSLYFSVLILNYAPQSLAAILVAYLSIPLTAAIAVALVSPITWLLYDLIIFMAKIKLVFYRQLTVIGITGSYGKTSTKEILAHLLAAKYSVLKTPGTQNTAIGVALTVLKQLNQSHQIFVVEMGAYRKGEISRLCRLVKPKIGILTAISQQHLSLFGSLPNTVKAKYELIQALPSAGLAVINAANPYTKSLISQTKHVLVKPLLLPAKPYLTNLLGQHQQLNLQAAVNVARHLHIKPAKINSRLKTIPDFKTAITKKPGLNQSTIIDDSYTANPDGFLAAIDLVKGLKAKSKILITSGLIELGKDSQSVHQQLFDRAVKVFDRIYITKLVVKVSPKIIFQPDPAKLLQQLKPKLSKNSLVLLASRLPEKFINQLCQNPS